MNTTTPTVAVACSLGQVASAQELNEIHRASVIRHASILADEKSNAETKLVSYFEDLQVFLEANHFKGCPYTNSLAASRGSDSQITKEVIDHKEFTREFFINMSAEITTPGRARRTGEHLFLLYSGATTEAQNLASIWPVERAIQLVNQILKDEKAFKEFESASLSL